MSLSPTKLRELCAQYDLTPSKKYGQNYLIQDWPIEKMIEAAGVSKNDTIVEIGPGFGVLTFSLAEKAGKVIAFEIEKKLENYWDENKLKNLEIIWGNALYDLKSYVLGPTSSYSYKVVANIPYQITSNLLKTLLELENKPTSITIMVQKEVAERICSKSPHKDAAHPRGKGEMSLLSVSVQYYGEPKIVDVVTKGNFWPEPKVDSAILHITLAPEHFSTRAQSEEFFRVVKAGFASKRKQLHKNLSSSLKIDDLKVKEILKEVCGDEKVRAEELSVENWKKIVQKLFDN